jgi:hypothetical protein
MPVTKSTTTLTEAEIREAIVRWLSDFAGGTGPNVDPTKIVFHDESGKPIMRTVCASVEH